MSNGKVLAAERAVLSAFLFIATIRYPLKPRMLQQQSP
jgi:hypothetical protein